MSHSASAGVSPIAGGKNRSRPLSSKRREQIVSAVLNLVADRGLEGVTITSIASAVGVTEAALYRHFENKGDILKAACEAMGEKIFKWTTTSSAPNVLERLRQMWVCHASLISGNSPVHFALMFSNPQMGLRKEFRKGHRRNVKILARIIEEGKAQGSIRADVDSEFVAWQFTRLGWAEDISTVMGLERSANADVSAKMLDQLLASIAAPVHRRGSPK
jgi:AcrR family transcriptional regulator